MTDRENSGSIKDYLAAAGISKMTGIKGTAMILNVSETTIKRMIYAGELPAVKVRGTWHIKISDSVAYFKNHSNLAAASKEYR